MPKTPYGGALFIKEAVFIIALFLLPISTQADLFLGLGGFSSPLNELTEVEERVNYSPTQTPLLSASQIDPMSATGGGDILVQNDSLVAGSPITEAQRESFQSSGEISVYTVREGDSLSEVAQMYGVTTNTILWANDISKASNIRPGDALVILPIVGVRHTVADGETLSSILKKYEADLDEVLNYNNLASADDLSVGNELIIPGGSIKTTATYTGKPSPTKSSGGASALGFTHPVPGSVRTQGIHGYNGVDLAAGYGTAIRAAAAGEVIVSKSTGWNGGYGQYVVVRHGNGTQTLYAHLSANNVSVGDWVASGAVIGAMGNTGRSTGTHLHFEVRGASNPF